VGPGFDAAGAGPFSATPGMPAMSTYDPTTGQPVATGSGGNGQAADDLIYLITSTIYPPGWSEQGGPGTIQEYNGLLIVNQTDEVQSQVTNLLSQISSQLAARQASK
jgi:hypothetical protein